MMWGWLALAAYFGIWIGVAIHGKRQQWSAVQRFGGGFLAATVVMGVSGSLIMKEYEKNGEGARIDACVEELERAAIAENQEALNKQCLQLEQPSLQAAIKIANERNPQRKFSLKTVETDTKAPAPTPVINDHNYVMQDGMKYGYPSAISENDRNAGQVSEKLVMALYAGEKSGKHQAHLMDGSVVSVLECEPPCRYLKIMTFVDDDYLRDEIKVEHIVAAPNSLGYSIMQDAMRGRLKQYAVGTKEKRYTVWMDERKGMQRTIMPKK